MVFADLIKIRSTPIWKYGPCTGNNQSSSVDGYMISSKPQDILNCRHIIPPLPLNWRTKKHKGITYHLKLLIQ